MGLFPSEAECSCQPLSSSAERALLQGLSAEADAVGTEWIETHFSEILLDWYAHFGRKLPWRETTDPYAIWVSEIILQQTRIAQGTAYYRRFLETYPTVEVLAAASEDDVLRLWQGLGYYSRARNLHAAARQIVVGGTFPKTYEAIRALKGVGDYTAAAIASFAFGLPHAAIDGNAYRVLSRVFGLDAPIDTGAGKRLFASLSARLLPTERAADYNQAMMDFGSLQCVPTSPSCGLCPYGSVCVAHAYGHVADYPRKTHRVKVRRRYFTYLAVLTPEGYLLRRRGAGDIWQGLYEFPLIETDRPLTRAALLHHSFVAAALPDASGVACQPLRKGVKHVLTHQVLYVDFYLLHLSRSSAWAADYLAVPPVRLEQYAMPKLLCDVLPLLAGTSH